MSDSPRLAQRLRSPLNTCPLPTLPCALYLCCRFFRVESLASSGSLANLIEESRRDVSVGVHVYLKNATEDVTPHLAAFLVVRRDYWYVFRLHHPAAAVRMNTSTTLMFVVAANFLTERA